MNLRNLLCSLALMVLAGPGTSLAAVTFALTFQDVVDHTNINWDDPVHGQEARTTLEGNLNEFGSIFDETAVVSIKITSSQTAAYFAQSTLAKFQYEPDHRFYDGAVYVKIKTGADINGADADGTMDFSFNFSALSYPDLNGDGVVDIRDYILGFKGLARHELIHLLGMYSLLGGSPSPDQKFSRHDTFFYNSAGNAFLTPSGTLSSVANISDPNCYFLPIGSGPVFKPASQGDYSHLTPVMYPYHDTMNADDKRYLRTLGYAIDGDHKPFFSSETALANGVYYLAFADSGNYFGYYSYLSDPNYIYHFDMGYEYVFDAADGKNGVYLYDFKSNSFFYTSPAFPFPYLYDFTLGTVLYYYSDPSNAGHYNTGGVRYFYNFGTGGIITK